MDLRQEQFKHIGINEEKSQQIIRPSMTYWQDAWRRLKKNPVAMISLFLIVIFAIMSFVGPMLTPYDYFTNDLMNGDKTPSMKHWFGTDGLGRDLWERVWAGAKISLFIGVVTAFVSGVVGTLVGGVSGFFGGKLDMFIMRAIDVLIALPSLIITLLIMLYLGSGLVPIIIALAITGWLGLARLVRGQVLALKEQEFVLAARTLGASSSRLILKHLIPNTLGVIIVSLTFAIPAAIFSEAFLSFIGLGIQPPQTSWGQLASLGIAAMQSYPYQLIIPSIFISLTMLSLQLLGDGLRDALDPRLRK
ncbi:MAG: binding-protein-dependent transport system inner rane component [Clostridia bacterium]|jgi:oligopeptide transport system permease protein|nr:binding-protein-dependent transport system inner rane component [Clostridia bacterium]